METSRTESTPMGTSVILDSVEVCWVGSAPDAAAEWGMVNIADPEELKDYLAALRARNELSSAASEN